MQCPFCKCDNVHICAVVVEQGEEKTTVNHFGTVVEKTDRAERGLRGSEVTIFYACEFGCDWNSSVEFHKGSVYFARSKKQDRGEGNLPATLWRD